MDKNLLDKPKGSTPAGMSRENSIKIPAQSLEDSMFPAPAPVQKSPMNMATNSVSPAFTAGLDKAVSSTQVDTPGSSRKRDRNTAKDEADDVDDDEEEDHEDKRFKEGVSTMVSKNLDNQLAQLADEAREDYEAWAMEDNQEDQEDEVQQVGLSTQDAEKIRESINKRSQFYRFFYRILI